MAERTYWECDGCGKKVFEDSEIFHVSLSFETNTSECEEEAELCKLCNDLFQIRADAAEEFLRRNKNV